MFTEPVILAIVTVLGGGVLAIGKSYLEGRAQADIEIIKARATDLEERLRESEIEKEELEQEIKTLEQDILDLETRLDNWKHRYWRLQVDAQELKMAFLRIMEKADIPTDQFEAIIRKIKEDEL